MINILVTGAGGGVGQGIIKSIQMIEDLDIRIITADMNEHAVGLYAGDMAYLISACNSQKYLDDLEDIFIKESIHYYFPGTDVELEFCAKNKKLIKEKFNVKTVISSLKAVQISDNKFDTSSFLKENGLHYPETVWLKDFPAQNSQINYPLIVKPAIGCRSIGVYKVNNENELATHKENLDGIIVQELVGSDDSEFTCTVVKVGEKLSPVLALKRILRSGDTYRAKPVQSEVIEKYVESVASKLDIDGSCNFQLRLDANGVPKIFEINCRYSGTTPFCAQLGFNPVEYYLKGDLNLPYSPVINYKAIVLRYWMEIVVDNSELDALKSNGSSAPKINKQFSLFE